MLEQMYSTKEVAEMVGLSIPSITQYARKYNDIGVKVGWGWVFTNKHIERIRWHKDRQYFSEVYADYRP